MPRRSVVALSLLLLSVPVARAQELHGRVRGTFQRVSFDSEITGEEESFRSLQQNYELNFKNMVARGLYWQARMRAVLNAFDQSLESPSSDTQLYEPFLQIVYEGRQWELSGGGRFTRIGPKGGRSQALESERRDYFGRVAWSAPERPAVEWSFFRVELAEERVFLVDPNTAVTRSEGLTDTSTDDRSLLTTSYGWGAGRAGLSLENRWYKDLETDFTRDDVRATGNADFAASVMDGRLAFSGQALLTRGRVEEETPGTVDVDEIRQPRRGLFAVDTTPATGTLGNSPALIDGDVASPAVDLTGDFRNIGVDLGFDKEVNRALVYVERRLQQGNEDDYRWDAYISDDGDLWTPALLVANPQFEPLHNRFEILFEVSTARFIKVVNTSYSLNEPPLAVTEIEVSGEETRTGREERKQVRDTGSFGVTYRATEIVDVGLHVLGSRQDTDTQDDFNPDEDLISTLTTTVRPGKTVTSLRLQAVNRRSASRDPERNRIASLSFAAAPLQTLDLSVVGTYKKNSSYGRTVNEAGSVDFRAAARILPETEAAFDLSYIRQEDLRVDRTTTRQRGALSFVSTLRPGLVLSNFWSAERIEFGGAIAQSDRTDLDLRSRVSWRPTPVFGGAIEYLYQDIAGRSGGSHLFDLDWLPFPGGALQVQFTIIQDRRSITGQLRDEERVGLRWTVNPKTLLDLAYTRLKSGTEESGERNMVSAFLEYRF